jgi:N-acetylglutamate synthase
MRARYVIRISPEDIGSRVSVRAWLDDAAERESGPRHTDAIGVLESWTDGTLAIRRKDGTLTEIDEASLVAGKLVPPPPPPRPRT